MSSSRVTSRSYSPNTVVRSKETQGSDIAHPSKGMAEVLSISNTSLASASHNWERVKSKSVAIPGILTLEFLKTKEDENNKA